MDVAAMTSALRMSFLRYPTKHDFDLESLKKLTGRFLQGPWRDRCCSVRGMHSTGYRVLVIMMMEGLNLGFGGLVVEVFWTGIIIMR